METNNSGPVECLKDYVGDISSISKDMQEKTHSCDGPWFRGMDDMNYDILPGAYWRKGVEEWAVVTEFKSQAPSYIRQELHPQLSGAIDDPWEWYFLVQHYGLPTRLLDWTENPLAALYFAVEKDESSKKNPCVWVLNPNRLNKAALEDPNIIVPGGKFSQHWLCQESEDSSEGCKPGESRSFTYEDKDFTNKHPIAIYPIRKNPRIIAQQGVFTIHGTETIGMKEFLERQAGVELGEILKCIEIEPNCVRKLRTELSYFGVHQLSLFPELPNLAEHIKSRLQIKP